MGKQLLKKLALIPVCFLAIANAKAQENNDETHKMMVKMYEAQAKKGNAKAAYLLAKSYQLGKGVKKSTRDAFQWYLVSAKRDYREAQEIVALSYSLGLGIIRSDADAYMWTLIANYNGSLAMESLTRVSEKNLSLEARERTQKRAKICVESNYTKCD